MQFFKVLQQKKEKKKRKEKKQCNKWVQPGDLLVDGLFPSHPVLIFSQVASSLNPILQFGNLWPEENDSE